MPSGGDDRGDGQSWSWPFDAIRDELSVTAPPAGAKVLDFGCADGKLLDSLQDCGWETWGIESAVETAFVAPSPADAIPDTPTFDLIVANHVFEHVTDPLGLLRALARRLPRRWLSARGGAAIRYAARFIATTST